MENATQAAQAVNVAQDIMTVPQVADYLSIAPNTVYDMIKAGQLPHMRFGAKKGAIRIRKQDLLAYIEQAVVTARPKADPLQDNADKDARAQLSAIKAGLRR